MISKFFIEHPVLANVLAIVIVLLGGVSLVRLPIAEYPNIVPPTVQVTTSYPGASARTVADTVATPIELQVNGVDRMLYMQSTSANDGTYTLTVTFAIGTDPDYAQVLVQNRVSAALAALPTPVQQQGVVTQKKSTAVLQIVTLSSADDRYDSLYLANYAAINLVNELARLPGVGNVVVVGAGNYAMRVWMDPNKLYSYGLLPKDVIDVIQQQSQQVAAGQVGLPPAPQGQDFQYTVNVEGRLADPEQFSNIVVKAQTENGGRLIRIRDVARVELGANTYSQVFRLNGHPSAGIQIFQTPEANALAVGDAVKAKMGALAKAFPPALAYSVPYDTTTFVNASIHEVYVTLIEAGILVLIVILVFLQDWRATLVPATTVPVTIIGAFAAMAALGFTVNISTLFGIVLAIGIVVDDAIVIVEGVAKYIERGMSGHDSAIKAMNELFGPIIGITLVLMSVFLPAAFVPGLTGQMFAQFALVIAATALISAVNAATLKPTQCALWLRRPVPPEQRNFFYRGFNAVYDRIERAYAGLISRMVHVSSLMVLIALVIAGVAGWGLTRIPTAFIPIEDQGYALLGVMLPDGAALERTSAVMDQVTKIALETPGVDQAIAVSGVSVLDNNATLANGGLLYVIFKDWGARGKQKGQDLRGILEHLQAATANIPDGYAFVLPPPPIQGIGNAGGFTMMVQLRDGTADYQKLLGATDAITEAARSQSAIQRVVTSFRADVPQVRLLVDRSKAETLRVSVGEVFSTLTAYLGSSYINQFNKFGLVFQVYAQADSQYRLNPQDILRLQVRNQDGNMVPIGTLATIEPVVGPSLVTLYNLYPAATIVGGPAPGFSSGQSLDLMEQIANQTLPPGMGFEWTAMSFQERIVGNQMVYVFGLAILLVYLCLAGQYESWKLPLAVLAAVPLALVGPVVALTALGVANNLYTQIGLMLLIALSAKNGILIVEVARERRLIDGKSLVEAAVDAARMRFRPILMTSFAFILGTLPLVFASGAGASARISLGLAVVSGMLASTCLAVVFVPSFFVVIQRMDEGRKKPARLPEPEPAAVAE